MTRLVAALLVVLLLVPGFGTDGDVAAQSDEIVALYDYNGDGEVFCDDFREEFPETYTDEATAAMNRFPEELSRLNNDPEEDDTACDGQPGGTTTPPADPVDIPTTEVPSDLPPEPPAPTSPATRTTTTGCDSTLVENGRVTVCAGQYIETRPFDFDAFAASAQDGFGRFSGSGTSGPVSIGVPSSSPATGASGASTSQQQASEGGNRVLTSEQSEQKVRKQKKKAKAKAKKGKRGKEGKRDRERERRRGAAQRAR